MKKSAADIDDRGLLSQEAFEWAVQEGCKPAEIVDVCPWRRSSSLKLPEVEEETSHSSKTCSTIDDLGYTSFEEVTCGDDADVKDQDPRSFLIFRLTYLFITLVVMLADGLQGTHLYVLYESYGFSVASLYSLGFFTGAVTAPFTGQFIDRFGRKKSALLYCALEVAINQLEQYPFLAGLVTSRVVGGVTTNLLNIVFEAWVDTEYRIRRLPEEKYEIIMRDSVIVSNLAAIASGCLSHLLAETLGPVGPFEGAVTSTAVAFAMIFIMWGENYGKHSESDEHQTFSSYEGWKDTLKFIKSDTRVLRMCLIQGFSLGSLHIFIFLWSPLLKEFAEGASLAGKTQLLGMDEHNAPAYGLIFGAYMAAGVLGGFCSPIFRKFVSLLMSPLSKASGAKTAVVHGEENGMLRSMDVEFQSALCYFFCSVLLLTPCFMSASNEHAFSVSLFLFVAYEFMVGIYSPCEGVIRSIYIPSDSRGAIMAIPTVIVNMAVAFAVVSTEAVSKQTSLAFVSLLLAAAGCLQLSLISKSDWLCISEWLGHAKSCSLQHICLLGHSVKDMILATGEIMHCGYKLSEGYDLEDD